MRVDIGSMLQGQVQTELPDILPVSAEQNGMQTESDFTALLGIMNSEENFQNIGMEFVSGVEKTDETADNIVEASVIEIPDDEHEFIMEESEDISPEKTVSEDSEDKKEDFYQQVFSSGLAADIQAVVYHNYSVGSDLKVTEKADEVYSSVSETEMSEKTVVQKQAVEYVTYSAPDESPKPKAEKLPEPKVINKPEAKVETKPEINAEAEAEPEMKVEEKPEIRTEAKVEAEPEMKVEEKLEIRTEAKAKAEAEPEMKVEEKPEIRTEAKAKAEAEPEMKVEEKPEIRTEAKAKAEPEMKVEEKSEIRTEAKAKAEAEPEMKVEEKPGIRTEAKAKAEPEMKVEEKPEIKAEAKAEIEPKMKVEEKPEIMAEAKAKAEPEMKVEVRPAPEFKAETKPVLSDTENTESLSDTIRNDNQDSQIVTEIKENTVHISENKDAAEKTEVVASQTKVQNVPKTEQFSEKQSIEKTDIDYKKDVQSENSFESENNSESNSSFENETSETSDAKLSKHKSSLPDETNLTEFEKLVQSAVTVNPFSFVNTGFAMDETVRGQHIASQTFKALNESIIKNRKNFVIRLNPEGLGEITVKLIKSDSSILVKMIASDKKTAELLNRDLDVLQDQLKQHNAELETVEYHKPENSLQNMAGGNSEFRSSGQGAEHRNGERNMRYFTQTETDDGDQPVNIMPSIIGNTILNRFI